MPEVNLAAARSMRIAADTVGPAVGNRRGETIGQWAAIRPQKGTSDATHIVFGTLSALGETVVDPDVLGYLMPPCQKILDTATTRRAHVLPSSLVI